MKQHVTIATSIVGLLAMSPFSGAATDQKPSNLRAARTLQAVEDFEGTFVMAETQYLDGHDEEPFWALELPNGKICKIKNIPPEWAAQNGKKLRSGETPLKVNAQMLPNEELELNQGTKPEITGQGTRKLNAPRQNKRRLAITTGDKTVLVVRVVANDANTTASLTELSDSVFGTSGDPVNLASQYGACSKEQLNIIPPSAYPQGAVEVTIDQIVTGASSGVVRNAVSAALTAQYGTPSSLANHVMYCLPPGTGGWIAYAYINHWNSVYNDQWCTYVSAQMHEIGHNLYLAHSGESSTYDDQTGMMGYSYGSDDTPVMCFNAVKNWQLGWYSGGHVDLLITDSWSGDLIGISDYSTTSPAVVIIKLVGSPDDYYVSFNRKSGINIGTKEWANLVLVHKRPTGGGYAQSNLVGKLSAGQSYTGGLNITVNSITDGVVANVQIGNGSPTNPPPTTPPPTNPPPTTPPPTNPPPTTPSPTNPPPTPVAPTPVPPSESPSSSPSSMPSLAPSQSPSSAPSSAPSESSESPSSAPSSAPSESSESPSSAPSELPSKSPSASPSHPPTVAPTPDCLPNNSPCTTDEECCRFCRGNGLCL